MPAITYTVTLAKAATSLKLVNKFRMGNQSDERQPGEFK